METAMQKFQKEQQANKGRQQAADKTYVPGATLPESGVKADAVVNIKAADPAAPANINDPKAQANPADKTHADGITGATVDGRGQPIVSAEVLKAKARAKEKEMKQLKPAVKTKHLLYSLKPGLGFFMGNKRYQFIGNYLGTDDDAVKEYALTTLSKYVSAAEEGK